MKKKLRVGMIGYGFMGKAHTNAFRQAAKFFPDLPYEPELKMFCARNEERAKSFASNWGYEKVVTDWKEVVESKEIDVIDICAPNNMHRDIAIAAAENGKWVLTEKPLSLNVAEGEEMVAAVEKAARRIKREKNEKNKEYLEKLVHINRITKVVKGGRRFGFSALVVVGNQNGKIGVAHAKAKQVPDAIRKANELARRNFIQIPLREGRTIHHDIYGKDGAGKIKLRSAPKGTGIIAGGPVRAVCEVLGVKDIVAKSMGTSNAHNVIRATMKALLKQNSPKQISAIRNKKISEIVEKRG